jgi:VIT1/CCC1 family predicted Fe2+/Mn2+ transporter
VNEQDIKRYLANRQDEVDSAALYRSVAEVESNAQLADVYRKLAATEEQHAAFWEGKLRDAGHTVPPRKVGWRTKVMAWLAGRFGPQFVLPSINQKEQADSSSYDTQPETAHTSLPSDERSHARLLRTISGGMEGSAVAQLEGRHRATSGNALRAAVLGANDGLSSNLSLVMGVAGATVEHRTILLTGVAGLLAGAFSMALGEWVSVRSARELAERELKIEQREIEESPAEEREELQLIYEAKGLSKTEADSLSKAMMKDERTALDTLSREELGIDPQELGGSPWTAAITSFVLFAAGAIVPVLPFIFDAGPRAPVWSLSAGGAALFLIGAAISVFTGRGFLRTGLRQLFLGFAAAGATYLIGRLIGVAITG